MTKIPKKHSVWDSIGKLFKGRKEEIPEDCDYCEVCGKIFPKDELHHILMYMSSKCDLIICDECSDQPPTSWRRKYEH